MQTKKLLFTAALIGLIYYFYKRNQNKKSEAELIDETSENDVLTETDDLQIVDEKYIELGDDCQLLADFKDTLNLFKGVDYYDTNSLYNENDKQLLSEVLKGTENVVTDTGGLRKLFLYDVVKTVSNAIVSDLAPRPLTFEYSIGVTTLGDKGQHVKDLQELLNKIRVIAYPDRDAVEIVTGVYDKKTVEDVNKFFIGTSALLDENKGTISKEFVQNFNTLLGNLEVHQLAINYS